MANETKQQDADINVADKKTKTSFAEEHGKVDEGPVLKSGHDHLGPWPTLKTFWKAALVCNLICVAAACDGYQIVLNGE